MGQDAKWESVDGFVNAVKEELRNGVFRFNRAEMECAITEIARLTAEVERLKSNEDDWRERFAALQGELLGTQDACAAFRAEVKRLMEENKKYSVGMQENCKLRQQGTP